MTPADFKKVREKFLRDCEEILVAKGLDYSGDKDCLANFKRNAEALGLDPMQVWAIYFGKHIDAIQRYVKVGRLASEPIEGRFHDAVNYLLLGAALIDETREKEAQDTIDTFKRDGLVRRPEKGMGER